MIPVTPIFACMVAGDAVSADLPCLLHQPQPSSFDVPIQNGLISTTDHTTQTHHGTSKTLRMLSAWPVLQSAPIAQRRSPWLNYKST